MFPTTSPGHFKIDRIQTYKIYAEYDKSHDGIDNI